MSFIDSRMVHGPDGKNINDKLTEQTTQLAENVKVTGVSVEKFPKIVPETTDTPRIQRAIDSLSEQSVLLFPYGVTFDINATVIITKGIHIFGYGTTLKTVTDGMDNILQFNNVTGFSVTGIKFDQNLKGRTSIDINNCVNFQIEKCIFTGYTAQYAHYQTDGGIRIENSTDGVIAHNNWMNHGDQYDATTATLNRCISIQGTTSDRIKVINNGFFRINQGIIVACGENNLIADNTFYFVRDNSLYILSGVEGLSITGNTFNDKEDECIVLSGKNIAITGNTFKDIPNKIIAITGGGVNNLTITGNTFEIEDPTMTGAQLLKLRDTVLDSSSNITFCDNIVKGNFGYAAIQLKNISGFKCHDNTFDVTMTANNDTIALIQDGTNSNISFKDNTFKNNGSATGINAISIQGTTCPNSYVNGNITIGSSCRISISPTDVVIRNQHKPNNQFQYYHPIHSIVSSNGIPTAGQFTAGDFVENTSKVETGSAGSKYIVYGWHRLTTGQTHVLNTDWIELRVGTTNKENGGLASFHGDGVKTTFAIPHGLVVSPAYAVASSYTFNNSFVVQWDATSINVTFATAPPSGTNNVKLSWMAKA